MRTKLFLLALSVAGCAMQADAQVQANKQLQMTGTTENDRRITGVGTAIDSTDAVNAASLLTNRLTYALAASKGNTYDVSLKVAPALYTPGMLVTFKVLTPSAGNDSLIVNGLPAKAIFKNVSEALTANDLSAGQIVSVMYDGSAFQVISQLKSASSFSGALSGDIKGTQNATVINDGAVTTAKISDAAITDAKIASGISYNKLIGAPTSLPPSGTAGGDLGGSYPNPTINDNVITNTKIAQQSVTTDKINTSGATNGQVMVYNGTNITWATPNALPIGAASGDLNGNYPNPTIANNAVTSSKIADGAVMDTKLANGSVGTLKIQDGAIISLKLADGSVLTAKVADAAITTPKIADAAITNAKLADDAVTSNKIKADAVTTTHVADGAITDAKINTVSYSKITGAPAALPPTGSAGGDLSGTYPNPMIAGSAITTSKIADDAVTDSKLSYGISYSKLTGAPTALPPTGTAGGDLTGTYPNPSLGTGTVTATKLAAGAVDNSHISATANIAYSKLNLANSITTTDLTDASITTNKVADGAITDAKLASGISYSKLTGAPTSLAPSGSAGGDLSGNYPNPTLATSAVTNTKIADGAVTTTKLNSAGATTGQALVYDGANIVWSTPSATPIGNAGGDLSGTYPNPTIANSAVTSGKIASGAITNSHIDAAANIAYSKLNLTNSVVGPDIKTDAISTTKIANGAVTTAKISTSGAASGQVLTYNGSAVTWGSITTTPTGAAGGDLAGTYPNPTVGNGTVTSAKIADGTIADADINASAAIAYSKLSLTNSIATNDLTNSVVTTGKIKDAAVTSAKIADDAVTDAKIAVGISYSKLVGAPTSLAPTGAAGGDLSGTYPNPTITTDAITTVKIADNAVTGNKMADAAVTTSKIDDGAVTTAKINTAGATSGQVLTFNGTSAVWGSASGSGSGASLQFHGTITSTSSYASGATVSYDNVLLNSGNQMNTTSGVFTATASGLYQINASLPATSGDVRFLALRVNGDDVFTGSGATSITAPSPYNATITPLSLSIAFPLSASDQVEIILYNNSGTATPITNGAARLLITKLN